MKKKIQKLHNLDCFKEKVEANYYIKAEEYDDRTVYDWDYL